MGSSLIRAILAAGLSAAPVSAQAQTKDGCQSLLRRGGKVLDTYVMDFGSGEKLREALCPYHAHARRPDDEMHRA